MSTRILEKFNSSSRYLYNEIQVRNYKKKRSIRRKYRMLGFKGGWPEIAVSRDRRNVQSTNTRPPSKIADTFYFTSRAPLRMVCWLRVFLPETLVSAPRAPSTRFTLEKKCGRPGRGGWFQLEISVGRLETV